MNRKFKGDPADRPCWSQAWCELRAFSLGGDLRALDRALLYARAAFDQYLTEQILEIIHAPDNYKRIDMAKTMLEQA